MSAQEKLTDTWCPSVFRLGLCQVGLSIQDVAEACGVSIYTVYAWGGASDDGWKRNPKDKHLEALGDALGIDGELLCQPDPSQITFATEG